MENNVLTLITYDILIFNQVIHNPLFHQVEMAVCESRLDTHVWMSIIESTAKTLHKKLPKSNYWNFETNKVKKIFFNVNY